MCGKSTLLGEYKANSQLKLFNLSAYIVVLVLVAITLFGAKVIYENMNLSFKKMLQ